MVISNVTKIKAINEKFQGLSSALAGWSVDQGQTHTKTKTYRKPTKSMAIQSRVLVSFSNNRKSTLQAGAIWRL